MYFTKITNNKLKGFSLAEVLISILIIAIMLALAIPVLTKKDSKSSAKINGGSRIFTFQSQSDTSSFPCYLTTLSSDGKTTVKDTTGKCQIYTFTVPNGVHKINLTLVAGGGGGGGAAGGTVLKKEYDSSNSDALELLHSRTKKVVIDYLIASGGDGGAASSSAAGAGGNSGNAITGHELPNDFLNLDYEPDFLTETGNSDSSLNISYVSGSDEFSLTFTSGSNSSDIYVSSGLDSGYSYDNICVGCNESGTRYCSGSTGSSRSWSELWSDILETLPDKYNTCKLTNKSFRLSVEGGSSVSLDTSITTVGNGYILYGGEGGSIPGFGAKGKGGNGGDLMFTCNGTSCYISGSSYYTQTTSAESGGSAYGKITAYIDNPGGVGGGGAGGTAIKINDFPVTPGETYTVSVGAGGAGGVAGTSGIITNDSNSYIEPKAGGNGAGGSSTAIYDSDGNLVLMVTGGVGGYGGKINDSAYSDLPSDNDFTSYTPIPDLPDEARNIPVVLMSSGYLNTITSLFDDSITTSFETTNSSTTDIISGYTARRLVNRFMIDSTDYPRISPYFELNKNDSDITTGGYLTYNSTNDKTTGGFGNFNTSATALSTLAPSTTIYYNGTSAKYLYLGFHQRYVVNNELAYAGGLGGFSGLGGKAGCGGLFVGNKNGLYYVNDTTSGTNEAFNNTFVINTASSSSNDYKTYNISDYYGNCTTSNSNGQTADFIAPSYIPAAGEKLGQAGGGGGGGGWSSSFGAGKGGDGQNGYVMITWRY